MAGFLAFAASKAIALLNEVTASQQCRLNVCADVKFIWLTPVSSHQFHSLCAAFVCGGRAQVN